MSDEQDFKRAVHCLEIVALHRHEYTYTEIADAKIVEARKEIMRLYRKATGPRVNRSFWQRKAAQPWPRISRGGIPE